MWRVQNNWRSFKNLVFKQRFCKVCRGLEFFPATVEPIIMFIPHIGPMGSLLLPSANNFHIIDIFKKTIII